MLAKIDSLSEPKEFTVTCGALRVTDPCYNINIWCSGQIKNVKNGQWLATVGYHKDSLHAQASAELLAGLEQDRNEFLKERQAQEDDSDWTPFDHDIRRATQSIAEYTGHVAYIHIAHADHANELTNLDVTTYLEVKNVSVGVDSGQAGFFDLDSYTALFKDGIESEPFEAFYNQICKITSNKGNFGTIKFGVASSAGYGDGIYVCYEKRNENKQLIAAFIVFITNEELND